MINMNNTVKLSTQLKSSNAVAGSNRNSKVDIKEICKKFESLSNETEHNAIVSECSAPIAPVRSKRLNRNSVIKNSPSYNSKIELSDAKNVATKCDSTANSTVKERTKLFEPTASGEKSVVGTSYIKLIREQDKILVTQAKDFQNSPEINKSDAQNVDTPPAKPPRTFTHSSFSAGNLSKNNSEKPRRNTVIDIKERPNFKSEFSSRNTSSISLEPNSERPAKNCRLGSAPEVLGLNSEKDFQSTPNSSKISGKPHTFLNYLKNISNTATNIREKVKQSSIFIDLTPTTVSPPKHYGTLKRSMSEEHIYAEPVMQKSNLNELKSSPAEPLHYMCTSLIPPDLPQREKTEEKIPMSKASVRNMIYGSFANVRATPKENSLCASNSTVLDNSESDLSQKAIQDRIIYVKSVRKQVSSSSICLAPKLYEALFIVSVVENQPEVTYSFPLKIDEEYNFPLLPHICFPDSCLWKSVSVYQSEVFHFTLIDKNETIFGYCLRIQGWPEAALENETLCVKLPVAICILSSFSAPVFYRKILLEIEKHLTLPRNSCFKYIRSLRKLGVPNSGASLSIPDISEQKDDANRVVISRPLDSHLVGLEMTKTLQLLDVDILVKCVASLFLERRILLFSASVSNLYHCCKAISSLLYPFEWPHQFIPVLPACLRIHCCSDQPYVLGIIKNNCESVLELLAEHELLIIDVDKGSIIKSCNDEDTILPRKVQKALISALNLAKNMTDPTEMMRDIMISEAFVHMSVEMIGHYENHFTEVNENMTFHKESFLKNAFSYNIRSFLQWFSETQMFDTFIEDSLWRIKYRDICQTSMRTFFEKRVDEYKWELTHGNEKLSRLIGKTVRNFGEMFKGFKKC